MNTTEPQKVGTIDFDIEVRGRDTRVRATAVSERGVVFASGKARCRKDDHFETQIGIDIAVGRALVNLGKAVEDYGLQRSVTEEQHRRVKVAQEMYRIADQFSSVMRRIAEAVAGR